MRQEDFFAPEYNEVANETAEQVRKKILEMSETLGVIPAYNITSTFAQGLKQKYGDEASSYQLYHALIGSTPDMNKITHVDFDGEDSIKAFILEDGYKKSSQ